MSELTTANDALPFALDDRTRAQLLSGLGAYGGDMPALASNANWAQAILGETPQRRAALLDPARARAQDWRPTHVFVLAVLTLLERPQGLLNQLPERYRDLYYRELLALRERAAQPDRVMLSMALDEACAEREFSAGLLFDGGQDAQANALHYRLDEPLTANRGHFTDLRWCVPGEAGHARRRRTLFDEQAGVAWPDAGVRLFAPSGADEDVVTGRVVGSTLLAATGGTRTWTVTFAGPLQGDLSHLRAEISVAEQWVTLALRSSGSHVKAVQCGLGADQGTPTPVSTLDGLSAPTPLLRFTRRDGGAVPAVLSLELSVTGATDIRLATPDGVASVSQPCYPFGSTAAKGSALDVMAAHWLQLGAQLKEVHLTPAWQELPSKGLPQWYAGYTGDPAFVPPTDNAAFKVTAQVVRRDGHPALKVAAGVPLFATGTAAPVGATVSLPRPNVPMDSSPGFPAMPGALVPDSDTPADWPWWVRLELAQGFGHDLYLRHLAEPVRFRNVFVGANGQPTDQANAEHYPVLKDGKVASGPPVMRLEPEPKSEWAPPCLPQWQALRVDYLATATAGELRQSVLTPFGYARGDDLHEVQAQAQLYLGVQAIEPGQLLNLHWQLRSPQPLGIEWHYLALGASGDDWRTLGPALEDNTQGWAMSAIMTMTWPQDALDTAALDPLQRPMPPGRYWLRACVKGPVRLEPLASVQQASTMPRYPWLSGLYPNAGWATLVQPDTVDASHWAQPLPAGSVTQALVPPEGLQAVVQPWPSAGGRAAETRAAWIRRVQQRLCHRDRALNDADLLTVLREQSAGVGDARMAHARTDPTAVFPARHAIVVMPCQPARDNDDAHAPMFSPFHLEEMARRLSQQASPRLVLGCRNPDYVPVSVRWEVEFRHGVSPASGERQVREALTRDYLAWVQEVRAPVIGKRLDYYAVLRTIQACEAVTRVKTLWLNGRRTSCEAQNTEVLVPVFASHGYDGWALAFLPAPGEALAHGTGATIRATRATIYGNGHNHVTVSVTLPAVLEGGAASGQTITLTDVFLYDCDTGAKLVTPAPAGLLARAVSPPEQKQNSPYGRPVQWSGHAADALPVKGAPPVPSVFQVSASQVVGTFRIGVGVDLPAGLQLRSHVAGCYLSLSVVPTINYSADGVLTLEALPVVPLTPGPGAAQGVKVQLHSFAVRVNPDRVPVMPPPSALTWTVQRHPVTAQDLAKLVPGLKLAVPKFDGEDKTYVIPEPVKQGAMKDVDAVLAASEHTCLWWIDPLDVVKDTNQYAHAVSYGLAKDSTIHSASLGGIELTFSPAARVPRGLALPLYMLEAEVPPGQASEVPAPSGLSVTLSDDYGNQGVRMLRFLPDSPQLGS